jgi:hypothetical protein
MTTKKLRFARRLLLRKSTKRRLFFRARSVVFAGGADETLRQHAIMEYLNRERLLVKPFFFFFFFCKYIELKTQS